MSAWLQRCLLPAAGQLLGRQRTRKLVSVQCRRFVSTACLQQARERSSESALQLESVHGRSNSTSARASACYKLGQHVDV